VGGNAQSGSWQGVVLDSKLLKHADLTADVMGLLVRGSKTRADGEKSITEAKMLTGEVHTGL
jgi:hypothetical protein